MDLNRHFPYLVACYLIAVGFFFILSDILDTAYLSAEPPGKYYLHGFSIVLIIAGASAIYLKRQGKLKKSPTVLARLQLGDEINEF